MPSTELEIRGILTDQVIEILKQETGVSSVDLWEVLKNTLGLCPPPVPRTFIDQSANWIDLRIDGDDLSFQFIPAVHTRFKLKISNAEWSRIGCVNDLVDCLRRHGSVG